MFHHLDNTRISIRFTLKSVIEIRNWRSLRKNRRNNKTSRIAMLSNRSKRRRKDKRKTLMSLTALPHTNSLCMSMVDKLKTFISMMNKTFLCLKSASPMAHPTSHLLTPKKMSNWFQSPRSLSHQLSLKRLMRRQPKKRKRMKTVLKMARDLLKEKVMNQLLWLRKKRKSSSCQFTLPSGTTSMLWMPVILFS